MQQDNRYKRAPSSDQAYNYPGGGQGGPPLPQRTEPFPEFEGASFVDQPSKNYIPEGREDITDVWVCGFGDGVTALDLCAWLNSLDHHLVVAHVSELKKNYYHQNNHCFIRSVHQAIAGRNDD